MGFILVDWSRYWLQQTYALLTRSRHTQNYEDSKTSRTGVKVTRTATKETKEPAPANAGISLNLVRVKKMAFILQN